MPTKKKFSQQLCNENDQLAKKIAVDFLEEVKGFELTTPLEEQPERYKSGDFSILDADGTPRLVEVERKKVWKHQGKWIHWFDTLDVPERKAESEADYFIMINNQANTLAFMPMITVLDSRTYMKNTIYTKNEWFFAVNLEDIEFYHSLEILWQRIDQNGNPL